MEGGGILISGLAIFTIVLGIFGGLSYGFYQYGATTTGAVFLAALVGVLFLLVKSLQGFLNKYSGRILFALWLTAILGAYFVYLFKTDRYPMGIDLAGGTELIYQLDYAQADRNIENARVAYEKLKASNADEKTVREAQIIWETMEDSKKTAPDKAAEVVRKRVDPTGTKGIPVTTLGSDKQRLRIQLPKATPEEVDRIEEAIRTQGRLTFHIATDSSQNAVDVAVKESKTKTYFDPVTKMEYELRQIPKKGEITGVETYDDIVIQRLPGMDGSRIALAVARRSHENSGWEIGVRFDGQGSAEFGKLTEKNVHKRMAIVLDGVVHSAPTIQEPIYGECRISGNFSEEEANKLAGVLTAGSLPAEVKQESKFVVGPSLGQEQIESGMKATFIGAAIVMAFMVIYYRMAGLVAGLCTLLNVVMLLGAMGFFKATLTLPGIAGIVLTLGMAVDANVLILERLREELERGRPLRLAVTQGFDRAFLTIIDCNLTTLISGIVLYYLGTGPVRGFAVSLSLGILTTLFCNLWLNWIITEWMVSRDAIKTVKMMQLFKTPNIDFMGMRKTWYLLTGSTALAAVVLVAMAPKTVYDVDFTGGTLIQFNFAHGKELESEKVKPDVEKKLREQMTARLAEISTKLKEAAGSGKTGNELQALVAEKLPGVDTVIKSAGELTPEKLKDSAASLEVAQKELPKDALLTQGFDQPVSGTKYRSYTVTTRLVDPLATNELKEQLLKNFAGNLEPEAVTVADNAIQLRLNNKPGLNKDAINKRLQDKALESAKDSGNRDIKDALTALTVTDAKEDPNNKAYMMAEIKPLPEDANQRAKLVRAVELLRIEDRAGGPISRVNGFGSQVAGEMWWQALFALIVANLAVFIYVWFRFEFSGAWGFGAIVALVHDVLIAAGGVVVAHMLGFPILINLNIVAALLTIIGFSVNDTIVVFDRIREVKQAHPTRSLEEIVNEAVNATLSRTILTSTTVMLATIALLLFGGPTIQDMALTLLVGFIAGTYSSVFIAAPLMIWWYRKFGSGQAPVPASKAPAAAGAQI